MAHNYFKDHTFTDMRIKPILDLLLKLFAIKMLMIDSEALYETRFFSKGSKKLLSESFKQLLIQLRPHMIPLAETVPILDQVYSVIGNKWGDIYEA